MHKPSGFVNDGTECVAAPGNTSAQRNRLSALTQRVRQGGPPHAVIKQRERGKQTARERIAMLLDHGSFHEVDAFVRAGPDEPRGDSVVTGHGTVDGRVIVVYAQDFTVAGGTLGRAHGEKIRKVLELAARMRCPVVGINDGAGGRIQEGVVAQALYGEIFCRNVRLSGVVPQISVIMGPCAGGAAYSPALTDFVVMVEKSSHMFVTGPDVLAVAMNEHVELDDLGGARVHNARSGNAHYLAADEFDALAYVRELLSYLPANRDESPERYLAGSPKEADTQLDSLVPDAANAPYDMYRAVRALLDDAEFCEVQRLFAPNIICGFGCVRGQPVGIVANQPMHLAGCLDIDASEKAARFVRTCNSFNVPIVTLVDVPGFLPGCEQEWNGIIRRGAKLLYAYAEATVPTVTVIVRKAYGGAYVVMGSKHLDADFCFAWPTAQIAVMGAEAAGAVLHGRSSAAEDSAERGEFVAEYERTHCTPYRAAERGYVDAVIAPSTTRARIAEALRLLDASRPVRYRKGAGNIPL